MKAHRFRTSLISVLFLCILSFPFLNDRFGFISDTPNLENRRLAAKPKFEINRPDSFPAAFEKYYTDTFALRSRIISYFNVYNCVLLKKSPFPDKVVIGNKGWLYLVGNDITTSGKAGFTEEELRALTNEFEARRKYAESKHCRFYLMITPSKANVHPENIPYTHSRLNTRGGEQLNDYLSRHSQVQTIDLFSYFRKARTETPLPLYYALDNHWNHLGAFYAANGAIERMSKDLPGLKPLALSDYAITQSPRDVGNMKQMLGNLEIFKDTEYELRPFKGYKAGDAPKQNYPVPNGFPYPWEYEFAKEIKGSDRPRLLILSDSFGSFIFPFLSENFSRTVKIFGGWEYIIDKEIVEQEKPDVLLLMVQEPLIRNVLSRPMK